MDSLNPIAPPIAMLHSVSDSFDASLSDWCVSRAAFLRLLDVLENSRYRTTHFAEIVHETDRLSFRRQIILSFDDCAKHLLDFALPELLRRNMKAVFYMPTAYIGGYNEWDVRKGAARSELMNAADLRELSRLGMEIGSHSHRHVELTTLPIKEQQREVMQSKRMLEAITGGPVYSFAYPYGAVPAVYKELLTAANYRYGVGIYKPFETALALRRFGVYEKDTPITLTRKLSRRYRWMRSVYDAVKKK